jgi:IclR family KDG regulon transcriptional repressor
VLDGETALCIDVVPGTNSFTVAPIVGRRWPLHTGAAGKLLLAQMTPDARAEYIAKGVSGHTALTIIDGPALEAEVEAVASKGWAEDRGEHISSVSALAAPIYDSARHVVAAVSCAYFSDLHATYYPSVGRRRRLQCD